MARRLIASRPSVASVAASLMAGAVIAAGCSTNDQAGPTVSVVSTPDPTTGQADDDADPPTTTATERVGDASIEIPSLLVGADGTLLTTAPADGNRIHAGVLDLAVTPVIADVGAADGFVLHPDPAGPPRWVPLVIADDETSLADAEASGAVRHTTDRFDSVVAGGGAADDIVPDTVPVSNGTVTVLLVEPTERYPHGALGDRIEAAAIRVIGPDQTIEISLPESDVVEGTSAMLADLDDDGVDEVIVTQANRAGGARLVAYGLDGELIAESDPIGTGNRWRHQIAVGPTGPNGETELVVVRTPHIGGIVEWFRLTGTGDQARLELVASFGPNTGGIHTTSHPIGTTLLDLAAVLDANGDGDLELVIPTQDRSSLALVGRTTDGAELEGLVEVPGMITTNLAVMAAGDGSLSAAVGTNDGQLVHWGPTE